MERTEMFHKTFKNYGFSKISGMTFSTTFEIQRIEMVEVKSNLSSTSKSNW